jgi:hypothetical protein
MLRIVPTVLLILGPLALGRGEDRVPPAEADAVRDVKAAARALRSARDRGDLPDPGEPAPDFHLKLLESSNPPDFVEADGEGRVRLSSYRGKRPVVLIFGSYT